MNTLAHNSLRRRLSLQPHDWREATDVNSPGDDHMSDGVYDRIKTRLLAQPQTPGQLLHIGALATELGVSTTPIREALTRLAAQRLIVFTPRKGFFSNTPTQEEIRGLHCINQTLLEAAIDNWARRVEQSDPEKQERGEPEKQEASFSLSPQSGESAEQLVQRAAEFFLHIAQRSGITELTQIVGNINDRLHHARLIEFEIIDDARESLSQIWLLYGAAKPEELRHALASWHDKRQRLASTVCKELLFRPVASAGR